MIDAFLRLPLAELEQLLAAARAGRLRAPVRDTQLIAHHFEVGRGYAELLARFESDVALTTFLEAIVAQRHAAESVRGPELVWSGPEPIQSRARHTSVVVRELFERAQREVFIAGYSFQGGDELLAPLHAVMVARTVAVQIVLDCSQCEVYEATHPDEILRRVVEKFWSEVWVHGDPRPALLYDPRTLVRDPPHYGARWFPKYSMHAKCVVVDGTDSLVGSANFTERAQSSNIEVGVLIRDRWFAQELLHQWGAARSAGFVKPA